MRKGKQDPEAAWSIGRSSVDKALVGCYTHPYGWMDGWIGGWLNEWTDE